MTTEAEAGVMWLNQGLLGAESSGTVGSGTVDVAIVYYIRWNFSLNLETHPIVCMFCMLQIPDWM